MREQEVYIDAILNIPVHVYSSTIEDGKFIEWTLVDAPDVINVPITLSTVAWLGGEDEERLVEDISEAEWDGVVDKENLMRAIEDACEKNIKYNRHAEWDADEHTGNDGIYLVNPTTDTRLVGIEIEDKGTQGAQIDAVIDRCASDIVARWLGVARKWEMDYTYMADHKAAIEGNAAMMDFGWDTGI